MIMSIKKSECQITFESVFSDTHGAVNYGNRPKTSVPATTINSNTINEFKACIASDLEAYYYKGVISLAEAIEGIHFYHYSWATVKLYYATFYLLRASLLSKDICFLRAKRDLFYLKVKANESFCSVGDNTDHKGTIKIQKDLIGNGDILLTNQIEGADTYDWLISRREEVNYKDVEFREPLCPDFWALLDNEIKSSSLETVIRKILGNFQVYCFQSDYAILALPLQRLLITKHDISLSNYSITLSEDKQNGILSYPSIRQNEYLAKLLMFAYKSKRRHQMSPFAFVFY